ncbi:hypothetical protein [Cohnella sp. JJ-181]|uniref:hypothetical protein n=1 Tax=Cohnella rhizoplanae TaxID=2974897 RepID=UPI0022FF87E6|nr:hypothetical protein [Cohnella sp. JJ-181]CAI6050951.1 hypothetical protein COHCIP112018_01474 [Cohnella sp. JJ-181]
MDRRILVAAPSEAGRNFIRLLLIKKQPVAAVTNSRREAKLLEKLGVDVIWQVNTTSTKDSLVPAFPIGRVFLFESSLPLTCQYLKLVSRFDCQAITVISHDWHPQIVYKKLGATYVVRTRAEEVGFLIGCPADVRPI